ncbi:fructosamine kinase family protein [Methylonatrum kenyense]|uniref:fructosamine kinase family protein n=1 Tax=Methylonatrum kenyense TaxID=455253 RepID=UPI0020BE4FBE|nr:fructosamine kinase family protein [Methylonatrum kenyense]MCK8515173.1 fructosamine kinase family protein [Methylonatrum kenyense]
MWSEIEQRIGEALGRDFRAARPTPVSGGSINAAWRLESGDDAVFVKTNRSDALDMFEAEAEGLTAMADANGIRVPQVITHGLADGKSYIALEWIDLRGRGDWAGLGERLAQMHRQTADTHGWHRDNTIGSTPQPNRQDADWCRFFADQRLGFQLDLAAGGGGNRQLIDAGRRLQEQLPALFNGYRPVPSLLHGDLWSGNVAFDPAGNGVLFDPATHYGDRECDLAMSELFGRFPDPFYQAYASAWPVDPGYPVRRDLYQLYHVLNHGNLFGGGYFRQAEGMVGRLLAEI